MKFCAAILLFRESKMALVVRCCSLDTKLTTRSISMTTKNVKQALLTSIHTLNDYKWLFLRDPQKDHTRSRKLPFEKTISAVLTFRGGTLTHDILDFFEWSPSVPTSPAFIQQRAKIIPEAFEYLFHDFTAKTDRCVTYRDLRLLAVDGSDLQCATNPDDPDSFFPGANGQRSYNLLHINAMPLRRSV